MEVRRLGLGGDFTEERLQCRSSAFDCRTNCGARLPEARAAAAFLDRAHEAGLAIYGRALRTHDRQHEKGAIVADEPRHEAGAQE